MRVPKLARTMTKTQKIKTAQISICLSALICFAIPLIQPCYGRESSNGNGLALVAGGTPAPKGRFPYMCSIRRRGSRDHACGGMLIASKWVLTAAHCIDPDITTSTGKSPLIYCGIHRRQQRNAAKTYGTTRCYLHHLWTGRVLDGNDIALCELDRASSSPIPDLVTAGDAFGRFDRFTVLGWGVSANSSQYAEQLQMGSDLRFVPDLICNGFEEWRNRIKNSMICAGFNDPNTCRGDSGGPLLVPDEKQGFVDSGDSSRDLIVGITSFGDPTCDKSVPGVYTRVSCYRLWIDCVIEGTEEACSVHRPCGEPPSGCSDISKSASFNETAALERIRPAIEEDDSTTVERILCEGLNPNATFGFLYDSLLQLAAREDSVQSAQVLIRYGADLEYSPYRVAGTPLHVAAASGFVQVSEFLIKNGANVNSDSALFRRTPLIRAVIAEKLSTVQVLLQNGADIDTKDTLRYTALHYAARYNVPRIAKALVDAGADIEGVIYSEATGGIGLIYDYVARVDNVDKGGWNALHLTARYNSSDVTKTLLDFGAKIESKTTRKLSALHIAAMSNAYDVAKILIDRGADANSEDQVNWTPLHFSAQNNSLSVAEALEAAGAKEEARSWFGYDPLMIASYHGSLSVVEFLLNKFASPNSADDSGDTPLHLAASRGQVPVVELLLQRYASKLRTNNAGETPFDEICSRLSDNECSSQTNSTLQELLRVN